MTRFGKSRPEPADRPRQLRGRLVTHLKVILIGVLFGSAAFVIVQVLIRLSRATGSVV